MLIHIKMYPEVKYLLVQLLMFYLYESFQCRGNIFKETNSLSSSSNRLQQVVRGSV